MWFCYSNKDEQSSFSTTNTKSSIICILPCEEKLFNLYKRFSLVPKMEKNVILKFIYCAYMGFPSGSAGSISQQIFQSSHDK